MVCPSGAEGSTAWDSGWFNLKGLEDAPYDPCRIGETQNPNPSPPYSYEYNAYTFTHEDMVNTEFGDGNAFRNDPLSDEFWAQEGGQNVDLVYESMWNAFDEQDASYIESDLSDGGTTLYRLREGIERFMITDINNPAGSAMAQSELPIMWDITHGYPFLSIGSTDFNHVPGGANVLYLDGHAEFQKYPGEFPVVAVWVFCPWD